MNKFFLSGVIALLLNTALAAQKTDFSGTWNYKDQESISGTLYNNGSPKSIKIVQKKDNISLEIVSQKADGNDFTSKEILLYKGDVFETKTSSGRKKLVSIKWTTDAGFTVTANSYDLSDKSKIVFTTTDKYSIENENLVLIRKVENKENEEVWESKAVYSWN